LNKPNLRRLRWAESYQRPRTPGLNPEGFALIFGADKISFGVFGKNSLELILQIYYILCIIGVQIFWQHQPGDKKLEYSNELVEVFYKAFKSLTKQERHLLATRILIDEEVTDDWIDHILIERARREEGPDVALDEIIQPSV